jgi:hypothetical protein
VEGRYPARRQAARRDRHRAFRPWVEARCRQGWRHLIVTAATGEITLTPDAYDAHLGVDLAEAD